MYVIPLLPHRRPKYFEMPPLLRQVIERRGAKGGVAEKTEEERKNTNYRLPAYKIYDGEFKHPFALSELSLHMEF